MEIAVISGKGGTGKSSISAAFATLSGQVVLADCDVDAANLYILFHPSHREEQVYAGGQKAVIDEELCTNCGICLDYCRFDAISIQHNKVIISETYCDGCKLCSRVCPAQAISMVVNDKSRMYSGAFRNGMMVYGHLAPGEENSGKLVNLVRDKAKRLSVSNHLDTIIIDGPPGIGCPVISTITGVDHVVVVAEPSLSGLHDLKRILELVSNFNLKSHVLINKYDLNLEITSQITDWCLKTNVPVIGRIPFDEKLVLAMLDCMSIVEWDPDSRVGFEIKKIWERLIN